MIMVRFEHSYDEYPELLEGPFEWIEMIGSSMFGLFPGTDEAEEIAGFNHDGSWDAGPFAPDAEGQRTMRRYTRWTAFDPEEIRKARLEEYHRTGRG